MAGEYYHNSFITSVSNQSLSINQYKFLLFIYGMVRDGNWIICIWFWPFPFNCLGPSSNHFESKAFRGIFRNERKRERSSSFSEGTPSLSVRKR